MFTPKVLTRVYHYPPPPLSSGIIELGGNSRKIFEFKGLIWKIFRNKDLALFFTLFSRNSWFRRRADASPLLQILVIKEPLTKGAGAASRSVSWETGAPRPGHTGRFHCRRRAVRS